MFSRRRGGHRLRRPVKVEPGAAPTPEAAVVAESQTTPAPHPPSNPPVSAGTTEKQAERQVRGLVGEGPAGTAADPAATMPGAPLNPRSPFLIGIFAVLGAFTGYGIVVVVMKLSTIIIYIVIALFIALGLEPIVARLVKAGASRVQAVLVVLLGAAVIWGLLAWLIIPLIVDQVTLLVQQTPGYFEELQRSDWVRQLNDRFHLSDQILKNLQGSIDRRTVTSVFGGILGAGKAFADGVVAIFTVFVLTVYFVAAMPRVKSAAYVLVPQSRRPRVVYLSEEISRRVGGYLLGQMCVAAVNGVFSYVILVILGLPYPAVLAVLIGVLALIPILGTLVGGTIITLVALSDGWLSAVIVLAYYIAYHLFETYVISPRIMSRAVEIPAVITIVAVLAGGTLLGVVGALIAIPVAAGLSLIYHEVAVPRQQRV